MPHLPPSDAVQVGRLDIEGLVHAFYADVRADDLLAPVFRKAIGEDWAPHMERMIEFWCTVLLGTRSFKANVFRKHLMLNETNEIEPKHFLRWISLWNKLTSERFEAPISDELQRTANSIGRHLFYGFYKEFVEFTIVDGVAVGYLPAP